MAPQKRVRHYEDEEVISAESTSSALRNNSNHKRPRLSNANERASKPAGLRNRSGSPSSNSSDSDEELSNVVDDDGNRQPPSTQYELLRDGDWEHLANPNEDDKIAERRMLARNRRVGKNRANENAIIEKITCVNFMCHEKLEVKLGPLINFVVGMNGSGKSAVLTAITLCLGGKAAATNRGASLKSLIKEGTDQAVLIIQLKNQGNDAYQPDIYGESIIIERHFSRSGSSSFKLKTAAGRIISSKKGDVDDLVEYYQLQVDNPMNVLTQDAAKSFITASTPAQKYKFFVEGVQLEALNNDYKIVLDTCEAINSKLHESKDDIKFLKKKSDEATAKHEAVNKRREAKAELAVLGGKFAWSQIRDKEVELAKMDHEIAELQREIHNAEAVSNEKDEAFQKSEEGLNRAKEAQALLEEELPALNEEVEGARTISEIAVADVQSVHTQHKTIVSELKVAKAKVQSIKDEIVKEEQRLQDANGGAHDQKLNDLAEAKDAHEYAKVALKHNEEGRFALETSNQNAIQAIKGLEEPLRSKTEECNRAKTMLTSLNTNTGGPLAGYDRKMADLLKAIENDRGFREKPVGPMGLHVKLLQPKWSAVLEATLSGALNGFVVTSKADQMRLSSLLKHFNMGYCQVSIGSNSPIDITGHEPDPQLIIGSIIDQTILIASRSEAIHVMYSGARPKNVKQCYAMHDSSRNHGHRLGFGPRGGMDQSPINPPKGQSRMKIDRASQISHQQETVRHLEVQKNKLTEDYERARQEAARWKTQLAQHIRDHKKLKIDSQRTGRAVEDIQAEIENLRGDDGSLDDLKRELEDAEKQVVTFGEAYGNAGLERKRLNDISSEKKRALDAVKQRLAEFEAKLLKARGKVARLHQVRIHVLTEKNSALETLARLGQEKIGLERERNEHNAHIVSCMAQAEEICPRPHLGPEDSSSSLDSRCAALSKKLTDYQRAQGGSDSEISDAAAEALRVYRAAQASRREMNGLLDLLKQSFALRMEQFRQFQRHISARSRINFAYLLCERAFRGKLTIDHRAKELDVHVEPDETSKSSKGRKTKTLSGGEKSFSSVCLLLALWEAMGAPLRCLDEFDVFMDDVNRDVSTKMIASIPAGAPQMVPNSEQISAARRAVGRQFILITPKALGAGLDVDEDVEMIK
ncbi:DNA repair protein [Diplocarpon rosae]|nr:DNA repair protein [Diplocarpon rosae]